MRPPRRLYFKALPARFKRTRRRKVGGADDAADREGGILHVGGDAVGRGLYFSQMIHFREELQDVEGDTFRLEPAGLELVHVEDVIHHSEEHVGGFVDFMTAVPQLLDVSGMAIGYFYHAEDAVDRGADVVAHAAEEIRLRLAGDLGFAGALSELFLIAELFLSDFVDVLHGVEEGRDASICMSLLHDEAVQVPDAIVIPVCHGEGVSFAKAVGEGGWFEEGFHGCLAFGSDESFHGDGNPFAQTSLAAESVLEIFVGSDFHISAFIQIEEVDGVVDFPDRADELFTELQPSFRLRFFFIQTFFAKDEVIDGANADRDLMLVVFNGVERGDLYLEVAMAGLIGNDF